MIDKPTHEVTLHFNSEEWSGTMSFQMHITVESHTPGLTEDEVIDNMLEATFPEANYVSQIEIEED